MGNDTVPMLPLPAWGGAQIIPDNLIRDYARANVAHATAAKDAEIEALRAEVRRLNFEVDAAAIYGDDRDAHYLQAETRAERLAEAGLRVTAAFRALGETTAWTRAAEKARHECEAAMTDLDALLREQEEGK